MAVTKDSRVRSGSLTFNAGTAADFSHQVRALAIDPSVDEADALEMLDGQKSGGGETEKNRLQFTVLSDHAIADGYISYSWTHRNTSVGFTAEFDDTPGQTWTGTVVMRAAKIGGTVGEQLLIEQDLLITSLTPPVGFTPAAAPAVVV